MERYSMGGKAGLGALSIVAGTSRAGSWIGIATDSGVRGPFPAFAVSLRWVVLTLTEETAKGENEFRERSRCRRE